MLRLCRALAGTTRTPLFLLAVLAAGITPVWSETVQVQISPATGAVGTGKTLQFTAVVGGTTNKAVVWLVNNQLGGSAAAGTITAAGLYTAPAAVPSPNPVTIRVASVADTSKSASATVTINKESVSGTPTLTPLSASVAVNGTQQFTASISSVTGASFIWTVNGTTGGNATVGTISTSGLYTAPAAVPSPGVVAIKATSATDTTKSASGTLTITGRDGGNTVTMTPPTASVALNASQQFTATIQNVTGVSFVWSVNGIAGGNTSFGTISATGLYKAPAVAPTPATVSIRATNSANTSISGTAGVSITGGTNPGPAPGPTVTGVSPSPVAIGAFTLTVSGTGFVATSTVSFGGLALPTVFVSGTQLTATGTATQAQLGLVPLIVANPGAAPSGVLNVSVAGGPQVVSGTIASRFLTQAAFGPSPVSVAHVQQVGLQSYLTEQFAMAPVSNFRVAGGGFVPNMSTRFMTNVVNGPDQLRQRVAFALSQIFVVSLNKLNWSSEVIPYQEMLTAHAFDNFKTLLTRVTLDPAMGVYLDMVNNDKANPVTGTLPNENYAREVMQLFTIGTTLLNPDGTPQLDGQGNPIPAYNQKNVTELARALTGWTFAPLPGKSMNAHNNYNISAPMAAYDPNHDIGTKTLLNGKVLPTGQNAAQDMSDAMQNLFDHPNVGPFVSKLLIQHLVSSNPSPAYVQRVAAVFNDNGHGVRGDLQAVINTILLDTEARQGDSALGQPGPQGHLQEPALFLAGILRAFNAYVDDTNYWSWDLSNMGQDLYRAPSVFNYYSPDFHPQGSALLGPEFQIHTPYTAIYRANVTNNIFNQYNTNIASYGPGTTIDLSNYVNMASTPKALVDALDASLTHGLMPSAMKQTIINAVTNTSGNLRRTQAAIYLITTSGFYAVSH